ncbi:hypothetical protein KP509_18G047000 [Ceratopteris richardii]|uniref:FLZ-type domain-containing protein n=1 Tax=Ceratopteris richardii TaxID=49495 RepID=A0A8T2ST30_CERRI|nr:hypothetical protein KP509_18G047000 [Ceratopteris richardii]
MCGGLREFERLVTVDAPRSPMSLLRHELKPHRKNYIDQPHAGGFSYFSPVAESREISHFVLKGRMEMDMVAADVSLKPSLIRDNLSSAPQADGLLADGMNADAVGRKGLCNIPLPQQRAFKKPRKQSIFLPLSPPHEGHNMETPDLFSEGFMSACFLCGRRLRLGMDIYMYRGDRAFCSCECRHRNILGEELISKHLKQISLPGLKEGSDHYRLTKNITEFCSIISVWS